jgi:hypothetical protein
MWQQQQWWWWCCVVWWKCGGVVVATGHGGDVAALAWEVMVVTAPFFSSSGISVLFII